MFGRTFSLVSASSAFLLMSPLVNALPTPLWQGGNFPEVVQKRHLYAKNDLRGKEAPEVVASQWLRALPSTKGKVVVVQFFLPWSASCQKLAKQLNGFQHDLKGEVVVVGLTQESAANTRHFLQMAKPQYAIGSDPEGRTDSGYGVTGHPFVAVVSPDGIVRWQGWPNDSEDPLDLAKLRQIVNAAKGKK